MLVCLASLAPIAAANVADAIEYDLKPSSSNYASLNECLYAHSKGTKVSEQSGQAQDYYIYKNDLWKILFNEESEQITCELLGVITE